MRNLIIILVIIMLFSCKENSKFNYPETKKDDVTDNYFGKKVSDPYRWLENDVSQETKKWVDEQNKVTFDYLHKIPFRQKIINRLTKIYNYERYSIPFKEGGKYFYYKNDGLQNQSVLYTMKKIDEMPVELLDPNKLSKDGTVALSGVSVSKNGKYLAYSISRGGSDWTEIYVKNIGTGKELKDHINWVKFSNITWYKNGFYYGRFPEPEKNQKLTNANINYKIYYHKLGTEQKNDKLVYENKENPRRTYGVSISKDEKYLFLYEQETTSGNGLYFKDLKNKKSDFIKLASGFDYDYSLIDHNNGKFLIKTNDNAPKYKLVEIDVKNYKKENWKDLIPEQKNVLSSCRLGGDKIIVSYMQDAQSKVFFFDYSGKKTGELALPGIGSTSSFYSKKGENTAFYSFNSYTVPSAVYELDIEKNKSKIFRQPKLEGINFDAFVTKQIFYKSKDGTKIPMFITHKKGIKLDGNNPTLLYGYGGFNISLTPNFSVIRMIWLENGGVYAVANIRGGGEYGADWHKAGTLKQKQNVFDDFISAGEFLISNKYTNKSKLAIEGGSNGGLLVGAVTNQRPDLFAVAIPHVGVLDMLRYQYFTIGEAWKSDYGLSSDENMFEYLYNYSPLHNIKENVDYPAVLVITADHDDRVVPAHSFKYIATLQEKYKGNNPVMIRIGKKAGHGAGKPISKRIEEAADIYSFIYKNMNVNISENETNSK